MEVRYILPGIGASYSSRRTVDEIYIYAPHSSSSSRHIYGPIDDTDKQVVRSPRWDDGLAMNLLHSCSVESVGAEL